MIKKNKTEDMKRILIFVTIIALILPAALSLMSCTSTSAGSTNPSQSVSTVTVTTTSTAVSTATVTVTPTIKNTSPISITPSPTLPPVTTTPATSQIDSNNNAHFYLRKDISGYTRKLEPDGTYSQTPIYEDIYVDWRLGGFFTIKDAIFVPRIPTMTDHDDWFFRFDNTNQFKSPWVINWGYVLKSNNPNTSVALYVFKKDYFDAYYYKNPSNLIPGSLGMDRGISSSGIRSLAMTDYGSYTGLIRTDNPDNILGWWVKFGGE